MERVLSCGLLALCWLMIGCAPPALPPPVPEPPTAPTVDDRVRFDAGLAAMLRHDRANDWNAAACDETLALLLDGAKAFPAQSYDAGLVARRCGKAAQAKALFEAALAKNPSLHPARAALGIATADEPGGLDRAIAEVRRAVLESRFADAETLVALGTLQMRRASGVADEDGADDFERAKKNLHRALAIDDGNMKALNQLAILHLDRARRAAGKKAATQALELAALICSQAIKKNPRWAPIHNTAGLVEVELGDATRAAAAFDEARSLDPRLVEAHMNLAALNLHVRGFARAEEAYRAVLALRPNDYDARLGLALALRGQIDASGHDPRVASAEQEIEAAKRIAPDRPEAYYNEAILVYEYGARAAAPDDAPRMLDRAKSLYAQFIQKADGAVAFADARERAKERMKEIDELASFVKAQPPAQ